MNLDEKRLARLAARVWEVPIKTTDVVDGELDDGRPGTYVISSYGECAVTGIRPHEKAVKKLTAAALRKLRARHKADEKRLKEDG